MHAWLTRLDMLGAGVSATRFKTISSDCGVSRLLTLNNPGCLSFQFMDVNVLWCVSYQLGKHS